MLCWAASTAETDGLSFCIISSLAGNDTRSCPCCSACSRASRAIASHSWPCRLWTSARALVSSNEIRICPARTTSPSATRIFLIMPPSRCWIVFRLDSDSTVPKAIAALSRDAKVDQVPRPRTKQPTSKFPVRVTPRSRSQSAGGADPKHRGTCQIAARASAILTRTIALGAKRSRECLITARSFPARRQRCSHIPSAVTQVCGRRPEVVSDTSRRFPCCHRMR